MKAIEYKGRPYLDDFVGIYMVNCVDYLFSERVFRLIPMNEMYSSREEAVAAIKRNILRIHSKMGVCYDCAVLPHGDNGYEIMYRENDYWVRRTYKLQRISWHYEDLERNMD